jgi:hypothetical protein
MGIVWQKLLLLRDQKIKVHYCQKMKLLIYRVLHKKSKHFVHTDFLTVFTSFVNILYSVGPCHQQIICSCSWFSKVCTVVSIITLFIKVKVNLSLCLTKHHAMKAYWEWRYSSTHSFTSTLYGGEWSASRPGRFTLSERAPGTHWIGGWVGPRAILDAVVKRKIPSPRRESNLRTPIVQPLVQPYV